MIKGPARLNASLPSTRSFLSNCDLIVFPRRTNLSRRGEIEDTRRTHEILDAKNAPCAPLDPDRRRSILIRDPRTMPLIPDAIIPRRRSVQAAIGRHVSWHRVHLVTHAVLQVPAVPRTTNALGAPRARASRANLILIYVLYQSIRMCLYVRVYARTYVYINYRPLLKLRHYYEFIVFVQILCCDIK